MRKSFVWTHEVWDYKDKEEFMEHYKKKIKSGFRVLREYESPEGYTVEYRKYIR